jgi:hypothetical protein
MKTSNSVRSGRKPIRYVHSLLFNPLRRAVLAIAIALLPSAAQAQAIEAWVQRYNGPGNLDDLANALAADTNGNVYVTGVVYGEDGLWDYASLKYSSTGVPLWTNLYDGMQAYAVAVDAIGDVYVTGGGFESCATIKYSSAGVPLWTNRYTASGSYGFALAVDASGNVVVAGAAADNYLTLKYSSAGALLWARQYNGPANAIDLAGAVAVDASNNVYVTGCSRGSGSGEDYATVAYSSTGIHLWTQRYNGPGNGQDYAWGVAADATGNVYVTGHSQSNSGYPDDFDYLTIKYSGTGLPLWTNRYSGPGNGFDKAKALAVDAKGNALVTGESSGDYVTVKYSSAGTALWTNRYNGPGNSSDEATAIAVDGRGTVYVTGLSTGSVSGRDYATIAYSCQGVPLWTNRYNGPGNGSDSPRAMAVDTSGSVYVTGQSAGSGSGVDFATVKYVTPPIITCQPLSCSNAVGTTVSFTVDAAGSAPFSYQWRRDCTNLLDGGDFSGVTTTNLVIANVQLAYAAGYTVVVTNAYGSVTSSVAQLTVTIPPSPGRFTNFSYSPIMGFSFIFRDATVGRPYRVQFSPSPAEGSWTEWMTFTYSGPTAFTDLGALDVERRYYRVVSP